MKTGSVIIQKMEHNIQSSKVILGQVFPKDTFLITCKFTHIILNFSILEYIFWYNLVIIHTRA